MKTKILISVLFILVSFSSFAQNEDETKHCCFDVETYINTAPQFFTFGTVTVLNTDLVLPAPNNGQVTFQYSSTVPIYVPLSVGPSYYSGTISVRVDFWKLINGFNWVHYIGYGQTTGTFDPHNPAIININSYSLANDN